MIAGTAVSCNKYLDIVPDDGIATLEMAYNMRSQAIKCLATCYKYMNNLTAGYIDNVAVSGGDELFIPKATLGDKNWNPACAPIALGLQNVVSPYNYDFDRFYIAIRYCNSLIDNIDVVPDMAQWEKDQWKAEAKVLKALYHFYLVRKWGPIPIADENFPIDVDTATARLYRDTIDDCFDYILDLLDEAIPYLYLRIKDPSESGRITKPIAATIKAKVAVYAASPLFNGNEDQSGLVDNRGVRLFPSKTAEQKAQRWSDAVKACEDAIDYCNQASIVLYEYVGATEDEHIALDYTLREVICTEFNDEIIWGNTQISKSNNNNLQKLLGLNPEYERFPENQWFFGKKLSGVPLKIANQFYTKHGIPVENDLERQGVNPEQLRVASIDGYEKWYLQDGYTTVEFNFDREPRFYADLAFDGSYWLNGTFTVMCPTDQSPVRKAAMGNSITGYSIKKIIKHAIVVPSSSAATVTNYAFPALRLAELYLLYAEAVNEYEGPDGEHSKQMFEYLDMIRSRAHIPGVKEAWTLYSDTPNKFTTKEGMREIIHRERGIEMAFEGQRFWDIRRWKEAPKEYAKGQYGWDRNNIQQIEKYYKSTLLYESSFVTKDYFWPFSVSTLENNRNLVQNIGW